MEENLLIQNCKLGDKEAFGALVEKYKDMVFNLAYRLTGNRSDASDIFQESFINVWLSIRDFKGKSSFPTWLYRIVMNVFFQFCRDAKRRREKFVDLSTDLSPSPKTPDKILEEKLLQEEIQKKIAILPEVFKAPLVFYDLEGLSYKETAEILKVSEGTVKSRIYRARCLLREKLKPIWELFKP